MYSRRHRGFTLIEMVITIVVVGVGLAGLLAAFSTTVKGSADPLIHKQMLAIAEEMMEEILLKPYAVTGVAPVNTLQACGAAVSRENFDDVSDYANYSTTGICDIEGVAVTGLETYDVKVTIIAAALDVVSAANAKKITVKVTHGSETIELVGWRTNYAS